MRFLQRFFSFFLLLVGLVLVAVGLTNYFIAPIHVLFEDPVRANLVYLIRLIASGVIAATGLIGMIRGKGMIHLFFVFASIAVGAFLFFVMEWYIALAVVGLSGICFLINFASSFKPKLK